MQTPIEIDFQGIDATPQIQAVLWPSTSLTLSSDLVA
jgi:hypothetical protein